MKLKYVGKESPHRDIISRNPNGVFTTDADGIVEVPDSLGESLLHQSIWVEVVKTGDIPPALKSPEEDN